MAGVTVVRDARFVGVVAATEHAAAPALAAIRAEWKTASSQPPSADLFKYLKDHPAAERGGFGGAGRTVRGFVAKGLQASDLKVEATCTVACIAHVPLWNSSSVIGPGKS